MPTITPHLWFDTQAKEAAAFYASAFPNARVTRQGVLEGTPSGTCDIVEFTIADQPFMAISAGPYFRPTPAISFMVNFEKSREADARAALDAVWAKLLDGGMALMPLQEYPFSEHYGWVQDKYGFSWQLMVRDTKDEPMPFIMPSLLFTGSVRGKAEEALRHYASVFPGSQMGLLHHYDKSGPGLDGSLMFGSARIGTSGVAAMDSGNSHTHLFTEAVSLLVHCDTQEEIDRYWQALSAVPESEQCGWLKDKFGVSWQISPRIMGDMLFSNDKAAVARVTKAFLQMKKFDIGVLKRAAAGE